MNAVNDGWISYELALLELNGLCGRRVQARIACKGYSVLVVKGILLHERIDGLWANYRVGDAELDLVQLQPFGRHRAVSDHRVSFYGEDTGAMSVDVWVLGEEA
jgi:hypothetical protein